MTSRFVWALLAVTALLWLTRIPGVFTVDEPNYLSTVVALRHGGWVVPGTAELEPSTELYFFDPTKGHTRGVEAPVRTYAPPLYAVLSWPFSLFGFNGLIALNLLAFAATCWLLFHHTSRLSRDPPTAWLAAAAFAFGSFTVEYAQAVWPHMLTAALVTAAFILASRARDAAEAETDRPLWRAAPLAAAAGLSVGLATGMRYQNLVVAGALGLTLLVLARRRFSLSAAFSFGFALPLAACSLINHSRLGFWNPVSKGPGYMRLPASAPTPAERLIEPFAVFWAKVVDFSTHPPIDLFRFYLAPEETSGAFLIGTAVKKAWMQSSPWILLVLVALVVVWWRRSGFEGPVRRELQSAAIVVGAVLSAFSVAGFARNDGLCFNQRYFFEIVPVAALALALVVRRFGVKSRPLLVALLAALVAGALLMRLPAADPLRQIAILRLPLALAVLPALGWGLAHRFGWGRSLLSAGLGAALMWSAVIHFGDDLPMSRAMRQRHASLGEVLSAVLPAGAIVFTWGSAGRNAAAPLLLDRDLVIVDATRDLGEDSPRLLREAVGKGRRAFVVAVGFPRATLDEMLLSLRVRAVTREPVAILEVAAPLPE